MAAAAAPGAGSMNSGPSPGMQASRYYLVLTYPEGQYDGEYVEGKKVRRSPTLTHQWDSHVQPLTTAAL